MVDTDDAKMPAQLILVTGTPCVGKTSVARLLASRLEGLHVDLTALALNEKRILARDRRRHTGVIDEDSMRSRIREITEGCEKNAIILDGHYGVHVAPKEQTAHVFVLRRNPEQLRLLMEQRGFSGRKLWENLAAEILDVCLVEAINVYGEDKVCELDVSDKTVEDAVQDILNIMDGSADCQRGFTDWLGKLEESGILEEYLKI